MESLQAIVSLDWATGGWVALGAVVAFSVIGFAFFGWMVTWIREHDASYERLGATLAAKQAPATEMQRAA